MSDEKAKKQRSKITISELLELKASLRQLPKKKKAYSPSQAIDELFSEMVMLLSRGYSLYEIYAKIREKISLPVSQFEHAVKRSLRKRMPDATETEFAAHWHAIETGAAAVDTEATALPERSKAALPEKTPTPPDGGKAGSRLAQTAASRRQATG